MVNRNKQEASGATNVIPLIAQAKLEWERTADALPQLVCLLDLNAKVMRVNRTVDRWGLGTVESVRELDLHTMLHPSCRDRGDCALQDALTHHWQVLTSSHETDFRLYDHELDRSLHITLKVVRTKNTPRVKSASGYAAGIIADVSALEAARRELETLNRKLEVRVQERTEQLRQRNNDLKDQVARRLSVDRVLKKSHDEQVCLSAKLIRVQERERKRIALELQDSIGQSLRALKYTLEAGLEMLDRASTRKAKASFMRGAELAATIINDTRAMSMNLRPSLLDDIGAKTAIEWFCRRVSQSHPDVNVMVECHLDDIEIPDRLGIHIFRIVQEALTNVVKHADGSNVLITLTRQDDSLTLNVVDDGVGFDFECPGYEPGLGIVGMRQRARMTGGEFMLTSESDASTRICVEWNLSGEE